MAATRKGSSRGVVCNCGKTGEGYSSLSVGDVAINSAEYDCPLDAENAESWWDITKKV